MLTTIKVGLHVDTINLISQPSESNGMSPPAAHESFDSSKNQLILFIYTFRKYMRWPLIALNVFFILLELLFG